MPTAVRDVMTTDVVSFTHEESVADGMQRLLDANVAVDPWSTATQGRRHAHDSDLIVQDAELHCAPR